jgi:hypothetical protein
MRAGVPEMVKAPSTSPRPISHPTELMKGYSAAKNAVQSSAMTMNLRGPKRSPRAPACPLSRVAGRAKVTNEMPTARVVAPRYVM